jgi:hypothetical protein
MKEREWARMRATRQKQGAYKQSCTTPNRCGCYQRNTSEGYVACFTDPCETQPLEHVHSYLGSQIRDLLSQVVAFPSVCIATLCQLQKQLIHRPHLHRLQQCSSQHPAPQTKWMKRQGKVRGDIPLAFKNHLHHNAAKIVHIGATNISRQVFETASAPTITRSESKAWPREAPHWSPCSSNAKKECG